ncbi:hypothetical protein KFL_001310200 [Klebsormidium nitens]|uniref:Ran guanine nucleotide release factor n=1 Tax=Klebsormidium nitens TaxID=105231 RepID=A0A1Y1HWG7_KLENI|nr:hypothetical protein KFL_001310200 [Klebsormidium nitens]|eukprot:GAQ82990.1 hypothetical protein KFL_001310200 [Klebsormidium nitens]
MEGVVASLPVLNNQRTKPLFGGAMMAAFPDRFKDVSDFRDVPDHQEVLSDEAHDESIIIELLELKEEAQDQDGARWFLTDLAGEMEAAPGSRLDSVSPLSAVDVPFLDPLIPKSAAFGTMAVSKYRQGPEAQNLVKVHLAHLRLRNVGTDVLVTVYEPLVISEQSESARAVTATGANMEPRQSALEVFRTLLATLRVVDWSLFGH